MKWPLARLTKAFDGNDKIVRVVQIQNATGFFIRTVFKLVLLTKEEIDLPLTIFRRNDVEEDLKND